MPESERHSSAESIDEPLAETIIDRREHRQQAVIERNHAVASAIYQVEQLLSAQDQSAPGPEIHEIGQGEADMEEIISQLPASLQKNIREVVGNYTFQRQSTKSLFHRLERHIEDLKESHSDWESWENTPTMRGLKVFTDRTNYYPRGKVTFDHREAYFIMTFDDPQDYALARNPKAIPGSDLISGGTFHEQTLIKFKGFSEPVPVLMVRNDLGNAHSIVTHERQHFINHKLYQLFFESEAGKSEWHNADGFPRRQAFRGIKDEVLAYVRDGTVGERLTTSLASDLYAHLFNDLTTEDRAMAWEIIRQVANFISGPNIYESNKGFAFGKSDLARGILVHQLAQVEFEEFKKWLPPLKQYYDRRLTMLDKFEEIEPLQFWASGQVNYHMLQKDVFDSSVQAQASQAHDQAKGLLVRQEEIKKTVLGMPYDETLTISELDTRLRPLLVEYRALSYDLAQAYEPLRRDGALVPHVGDTGAYYYGDTVEDSHDHETEFSLRVRSAVLEVIMNMDQNLIDQVVTDIIDDNEDLTAVRKFSHQVKAVVHAMNPGRRCALLYTDAEESFRDSVEVEIDFASNDIDRENGFKGSRFIVNIHRRSAEPF